MDGRTMSAVRAASSRTNRPGMLAAIHPLASGQHGGKEAPATASAGSP